VDKTTDGAALEALGMTRELAERSHGIVRELRELVEAQSTPATPKTIVLTQQVPVQTDDAKRYSQSIGLYNPTNIRIFLGLDGARASAAARGWGVPPASLVVLPLAAMTVDIGVDPADHPSLLAGDAVVVLLRFESVQPAFIGKGV
jgi:hypothetical protein